MERIVLAGGCFWCIEAGFELITGVESAVSGYAGGKKEDADYEIVSTGTTGHAESVQVTFDPKVINLAEILDIFWALHNPTTLNQQGNDIGPQYRSAIFYADDHQKEVAEAAIKKVQTLWHDPVVTELAPLDTFYPAEEYHQHYFEKNPGNGYCQIVINPKLQKLRKEFSKRMKK